jgi:hypothetical protein
VSFVPAFYDYNFIYFFIRAPAGRARPGGGVGGVQLAWTKAATSRKKKHHKKSAKNKSKNKGVKKQKNDEDKNAR